MCPPRKSSTSGMCRRQTGPRSQCILRQQAASDHREGTHTSSLASCEAHAACLSPALQQTARIKAADWKCHLEICPPGRSCTSCRRWLKCTPQPMQFAPTGCFRSQRGHTYFLIGILSTLLESCIEEKQLSGSLLGSAVDLLLGGVILKDLYTSSTSGICKRQTAPCTRRNLLPLNASGR